MENLTNITILRARPGLSEALGRALERLIEPCRAAAGCLQFRVHRSQDEVGVWCIYETWRSRADLRDNLCHARMDGYYSLLRHLAEPELDLLTFSEASSPAGAANVAGGASWSNSSLVPA
ncbi:antibiotic biosynthesis monooxygenase [Sinorhizobium sp. RAC02]|uniref:putative quinol monooxygenase n=1 Tax=Sinorhizobium sp. RAC02 TaxID=1842534 RepID=UPI00083E4F9B|nr:antibiotic biosynthesis monooxygenase [Sinorhizobium sp. RAC02]AOF92653.1 antibiotic biosynthesis monooxygenase family protein [Sinorhizobium sp. RAC02]